MRYPSDKAGLALPITEVGFEVAQPYRRLTSRHHLYYQRCMYKDVPVRHVFRNLVDHVVDMSNSQHNLLHDRFLPPKMPNYGLMIDVLDEYLALNGVIECVKERKTSVTYQIQPEQWDSIRSGYGTTLHQTGNRPTYQ